MQFLSFRSFCEVTFSDFFWLNPQHGITKGPPTLWEGHFLMALGLVAAYSTMSLVLFFKLVHAGTSWYKLVQAGTSSGTICYLPMLLANVLLNLLDNAKFLVRFKLVQMINRKRENKCQLCCLTQIYPNICQLSDIA